MRENSRGIVKKYVAELKDYIRKREALFTVLEPIYYYCAKAVEWTKLFFADRGILKYYILYPLGSMYRVIRAKMQSSYLKELKEIRNMYRGKRCFIVAAGPSLQIADLDKLSTKKEVTFGLNSIYRLYDKTRWRPDFYCCLDLELEKEIEKNYGKNAFKKLARKFCFVDSKVKSKKMPNKVRYIHYNRLLHGFGKWDDDFRYSDNLIWGLYDLYDVTCSTIQIAKWMGFKEVYLLGVDCNYLDKKKYAEGARGQVADELKEEEYIYIQGQKEKAFRYLGESIAHNSGFKVYNATRGGRLEIFPHVDFDKL